MFVSVLAADLPFSSLLYGLEDPQRMEDLFSASSACRDVNAATSPGRKRWNKEARCSGRRPGFADTGK